MPLDYPTMLNLHGRAALITGGARGIGFAIGEAMATFGARVMLADLRSDAADAAAGRLQAKGLDVHAIGLDVTDSAAVDAVFAADPDLDILVNNAGISARIPAEDYGDAELDAMLALNVKGVFHGMRAAARRWIDNGLRGRIINLASFAGVVADPLSAPYAASKGAVVQLTRTCAVEWAPHGIRVNAIGPGYVRTEMTAQTLDAPDTAAAIKAKTPMGRPGSPDEIAGAAVFLASEASTYVTGHVLMVDGGWTAI